MNTIKKSKPVSIDSLQKRFEHFCTYLNKIDIAQCGKERLLQLKQVLDRFLRALKGTLSRAKLVASLGSFAFLLNINANGQNFLPPVQDPFGITAAGLSNLDFGDLDGDGDLDMMFHSTNYPSGFFAYKENVGSPTNPSFGGVQLNPFGINPGPTDWYGEFVDIDNDGDLDWFCGNYDGDIRFFQNSGTPTAPDFSGPVFGNPFSITPVNFFYFSDPHFVDVDGDGDMDLITYDYPQGGYTAELIYQENTGTPTSPQFANPSAVPFSLHGVANGYSFIDHGDLDKDGDLDFVLGDFYSGDVRFSENIGTPTMPTIGSTVLNPFGITKNNALSQPVLVDIDGDLDLDLFLSDSLHVNFMEHVDSLTTEILEDRHRFQGLFPNPFNEEFIYQAQDNGRIELYDQTGRIVVQQDVHQGKNIVITDHLKAGVYSVRTFVKNHPVGSYRIIKALN